MNGLKQEWITEGKNVPMVLGIQKATLCYPGLDVLCLASCVYKTNHSSNRLSVT